MPNPYEAPYSVEGWTELIEVAPTDPMLRARFAAELIRHGMFDEAEQQLTTCLDLAPAHAKPRLLVVVLRARVKMAARRSKLVHQDLHPDN
jgi:hypothetical protein